jgi:hypothetical protein
MKKILPLYENKKSLVISYIINNISRVATLLKDAQALDYALSLTSQIQISDLLDQAYSQICQAYFMNENIRNNEKEFLKKISIIDKINHFNEKMHLLEQKCYYYVNIGEWKNAINVLERIKRIENWNEACIYIIKYWHRVH